MSFFDYLVIGGGIAGTSAAEAIRTQDSQGSIAIIEQEPYPLYSRVQIPFYIKGMKERNQVFLRSLESYKEKNINLFISTEVLSLNSNENTVLAKNSSGTQTLITYDKLLITTGGQPKRLDKYANELYMHTLDDADTILRTLQIPQKAYVLGSGFIALEFIDIFLKNSMDTTAILKNTQFWPSFMDIRLSDELKKILVARGLKLDQSLPDSTIALVGIGVGLDRNVSLLENSGIDLNIGIVTDQFFKTNIRNIWAAGDIAEYYSERYGKHIIQGNWTHALNSGKRAGLNMVLSDQATWQPYDLVTAYSITMEGLNLIFLGLLDIDSKTKVSIKILSDGGLAQLNIKNNKLQGCILLNAPQERKHYQQIIEQGLDL